MHEKIKNDLKEAMRSRDELRLSVLRMLSSAIHNREIEKRTHPVRSQTPEASVDALAHRTSNGARSGESELTEEEIVAVIRSEIKKRRDAAEGFTKGGRVDAAEQESEELKILEAYLPAELSDEEIEKTVKEIIAGMGEVTTKEFGKVMGEVMKRLRGQASGDRVGGLLRKILSA